MTCLVELIDCLLLLHLNYENGIEMEGTMLQQGHSSSLHIVGSVIDLTCIIKVVNAAMTISSSYLLNHSPNPCIHPRVKI